MSYSYPNGTDEGQPVRINTRPYEGPNRIQKAIEAYRTRLSQVKDPAKLLTVERATQLEQDDLATLKTHNSIAFASGRVTLEESEQVYRALSNWERQDTPTKITVIQAMTEILKS